MESRREKRDERVFERDTHTQLNDQLFLFSSCRQIILALAHIFFLSNKNDNSDMQIEGGRWLFMYIRIGRGRVYFNELGGGGGGRGFAKILSSFLHTHFSTFFLV
jgi:hypothetical protein